MNGCQGTTAAKKWAVRAVEERSQFAFANIPVICGCQCGTLKRTLVHVERQVALIYPIGVGPVSQLPEADRRTSRNSTSKP